MLKAVPNNISLEFEWYCDECPEMEVAITSQDFFYGDKSMRHVTIYCENRKICEKLKERFGGKENQS